MGHQPSPLRSPYRKIQRPGFQRLAVGAEYSLEKIYFHGPESFERFGKPDLDHAIRTVVVGGEIERRSRRSGALCARILHANAALERGRIEIARELNADGAVLHHVRFVFGGCAEDHFWRRP